MIKSDYIIAAFFALVGGINSATYIKTQSNNLLKSHENDLLSGASAYIEQYEGENPKEVLNYAKQTLEIVARNKDIPSEEISKLEQEISTINEEISDSPEIYKPVLNSTGKKLQDLQSKYSKDNLGHLISAICFGFGSICFLISSKFWKKQD